MQEFSPPLHSATRQRLTELNDGDTVLPMPAGPKWACLLPSITGAALTESQRRAVLPQLARLKPLNITLGQPDVYQDGLLARSAQDEDGQSRAYMLLRADGSLEIVAALRTGSWPPAERTWWPGAYEQALLTQLRPEYLPLAGALARTATNYLCMGLLNIAGTFLIANERPYPMPAGIDLLPLPPVRLDRPAEQVEQQLIEAFDHVRASACVASPHAFYL